MGWDRSPLGFALFATPAPASPSPGLTPPSPGPRPAQCHPPPPHRPPPQSSRSAGDCEKTVACRFGNETQRTPPPPNGASSQSGSGGPGSKCHTPPKSCLRWTLAAQFLRSGSRPSLWSVHPVSWWGPLCSVPTLHTEPPCCLPVTCRRWKPLPLANPFPSARPVLRAESWEAREKGVRPSGTHERHPCQAGSATPMAMRPAQPPCQASRRYTGPTERGMRVPTGP